MSPRLTGLTLLFCLSLPVLYPQDIDTHDLSKTIREVQENVRQLQAQIKQLDGILKDLSAQAKRLEKAPISQKQKQPDFQQASRFYEQGLQSEKDGLYDFAVQAYTVALSADPNSDAAYQ